MFKLASDVPKILLIAGAIVALILGLFQINTYFPIFNMVVNAFEWVWGALVNFSIPLWEVIIIGIISIGVGSFIFSNQQVISTSETYGERHLKDLLDSEMNQKIVAFCSEKPRASHEIQKLVEMSRFEFNGYWLTNLSKGALTYDEISKTWTSTPLAREVLVKYYGAEYTT